MSNHNPFKAILLHHKQAKAGPARKAERAESRRIKFEFNRAEIRIKVDAERQYLATCALVFLMGLILMVSGLFYLAGAILYG